MEGKQIMGQESFLAMALGEAASATEAGALKDTVLRKTQWTHSLDAMWSHC